MRWIHFSDIHYKILGDGGATEQLRDDLVEYVRNNHFEADYLFFTGDYRFACEKESEEKSAKVASSYIHELANACGVHDSSRIFLVPGNHDLKRIKEETVNRIRDSYDVSKGDFLQKDQRILSRRFSFFRALENIIHPSSSIWYEGDILKNHVYTNIEEASLLLLNTAITCNDDQERGKLVIGNHNLYSALKAVSKEFPQKPIIILAHHALDMFSVEESKRVEGLLRRFKVRLYLCGDAHKVWYRSIGNNTLELTMGCIAELGSSGYQAVFSCGEIKDGLVTELKAFQWDPQLMEWGQYSQFNQSIVKSPFIAKKETNVHTHVVSVQDLVGFAPRNRTLLSEKQTPVLSAALKNRIQYALNMSVKWVESVQNDDFGLPTDDVGSESCTWATISLLWSCWVAAGMTPKWWMQAYHWVLSQVNLDGGIPLVYKHDVSITDATAQGLLCACCVGGSNEAWIFAKHLLETQMCGGWKWSPTARTYNYVSTAIAILALHLYSQQFHEHNTEVESAIQLGKNWLINNIGVDGGWGSHPKDISRPANTGYILYVLSALGESDFCSKSFPFLKNTFDPLKSGWSNSMDRPASHSVTRLGLPYVIMGLSGMKRTKERDDLIEQAFEILLKDFSNGTYNIATTIAKSWPTRDFILACSCVLRDKF